ncbi:MAG: TnsA-like heteromeric transposase endonuclease subunit [Mycobacterium sp.]|nr:TnsA-like heteromeric transposase endonuclease subunit [Mycobacterium sp.]
MALFIDPATGKRVRRRITTALAHLPFETAAPIRRFPAYRGRRAHQGRYWFSRSHSRVNHESLFEKTALRVLDFRGDVVQVSSNPLWLLWAKESGPQRHAPDYFGRCRDGSALVVDVKPQQRFTDEDRIQHARTREVCDELGWRYEEFTTIDPVVDRNLRLLAGYNRPHFAFDSADAQVAMTALSAADNGQTRLADLLDAVCGATGIDDATGLCGIYHMVWFGQLRVDLTHPLAWNSEVYR